MATPAERCGAVILCGGQSRRMGTCKALLTVDGVPVLHRLAGELSFFEERLLSANDAALGAGLSWTLVEDRFPGLGPGAGLHAALLASKKDALLCVPCDLPAFSEQAARCLLFHFPQDCAAMVCRDGAGQLHPLCGIYTRRMLPALERRLAAGRCRMMELLEDAAELAEKNMEKNALQDRSRIICGDIRRHRELFKSGSFDLVAANPPYFPVERGKLSPDEKRSGARGEVSCSLEDICAAASYLCCTGGSFSVVYKPERLSELFCAMTAHGLEPKRLRLVCYRQDSAPSLVLVEGRRGGKPGLDILPPLILTGPEGGDSQEVLRIYHRN